MRASHEAAAQAQRDHESKLATELHRRKEERMKQREELQRREDSAVDEGEKRLAEMKETQKEVEARVGSKREDINSKKALLRKEDNEDDADLAAVEAKVHTLLEAHDEQRKREVEALREQLRPQREKWETALQGLKVGCSWSPPSPRSALVSCRGTSGCYLGYQGGGEGGTQEGEWGGGW